MANPQRIVVVGSGLAGASAAGALRERGFDGEVLLFGQESHRPYELPALSKDILLGNADEPAWVHEEDFYADKGIDRRHSTEIREVRPADRVVVDSAGATHSYDRLLLATGSQPRTLPVPGAELAGLRTLRTLDDSLALRDELKAAGRVVIVGAGWIGCEVAAAAIRHDADVTVVDTVALPLQRVLGDTIGEVFRNLHAEQGVAWRLGAGVEGFLGGDDGRVRAVRLAGGDEVPADLVVLGVGAAPRLGLAERAGIELTDEVPGGGVAVDAALRTSVPEIYAAGDIAAHAHPRYGRRVRVEHWANAKDQGAHVAGNLLGAAEPFQASPYFFSDQYDLGMEYRGLADPGRDELVVRGDTATREFIAFWLRDGRLQAAMNVNLWDDGDALQALVDAQAALSPDQLRTADLAALV
ncbi:NAD(P)/FAD-dependent oxidoreductase [Solihabitans fulvus]|uniref:NAD(P)/FAD-dependent oxidoreductase n=1 Tax=Solihabitans fulvus TaxID=1892852 RepID=A0A5B2XEE1_9PSEU|nr:FAD-dependent oxidoreductase [Solihabitans fulvus]KAA2261310.1 NAD(P)/FAD-dependent oxidoreductase [Solihabitans fulvus]